MSELLDTDLLAYGRKNVKYSNVVGTNYSTGSASVAVTTGVVTGSGTTFTAAMVGGLIKFTGHTDAYYVSAYSSATSITIIDQGGTTFTGSAIAAAGAAEGNYTIWGATHLAITKSTVYRYLVQLSTALSGNLAPREDRFLVVNAATESIIRQAPEFIPAVQSAYSGVVEKGLLGSIAGFKIYFSELVDGNSTTGYWLLGGNKKFMSFAAQIMKVSVVPSDADPNSFITTCKGLLVWGRKVFAGTRALGGAIRIVPTAS